jgi:hypothetical protein
MTEAHLATRGEEPFNPKDTLGDIRNLSIRNLDGAETPIPFTAKIRDEKVHIQLDAQISGQLPEGPPIAFGGQVVSLRYGNQVKQLTTDASGMLVQTVTFPLQSEDARITLAVPGHTTYKTARLSELDPLKQYHIRPLGEGTDEVSMEIRDGIKRIMVSVQIFEKTPAGEIPAMNTQVNVRLGGEVKGTITDDCGIVDGYLEFAEDGDAITVMVPKSTAILRKRREAEGQKALEITKQVITLFAEVLDYFRGVLVLNSVNFKNRIQKNMRDAHYYLLGYGQKVNEALKFVEYANQPKELHWEGEELLYESKKVIADHQESLVRVSNYLTQLRECNQSVTFRERIRKVKALVRTAADLKGQVDYSMFEGNSDFDPFELPPMNITKGNDWEWTIEDEQIEEKLGIVRQCENWKEIVQNWHIFEFLLIHVLGENYAQDDYIKAQMPFINKIREALDYPTT